MDGHPLRYSVYQLYGLAPTAKKAANPSYQRTAYSKMDELREQDRIVNVIERLAESRKHTLRNLPGWSMDKTEPVVYRVQKTIAGRGYLETSKLLRVDEMFHIF